MNVVAARTLLATAMTAALPMAPTPASADIAHCVSAKEWVRVGAPWTERHVHRVFDVNGSLIRFRDDGDIMVRQYRMCNGDRVHISYWGGHKNHWHLFKMWGRPR